MPTKFHLYKVGYHSTKHTPKTLPFREVCPRLVSKGSKHYLVAAHGTRNRKVAETPEDQEKVAQATSRAQRRAEESRYSDQSGKQGGEL